MCGNLSGSSVHHLTNGRCRWIWRLVERSNAGCSAVSKSRRVDLKVLSMRRPLELSVVRVIATMISGGRQYAGTRITFE